MITASIVADSISPAGVRLATMELTYPRFVHAELLTHRVFSRNASSSRAIPVARLTQAILDEPGYPVFWGKNQPGMQADAEHDAPVIDPFTGEALPREEAWRRSAASGVAWSRAFAEAGYHKQLANRHSENLGHIRVVVSSVNFVNFFALRDHKDAQPEIRMLAEQMRSARNASVPQPLELGQWHLPYVTERDYDMALTAPDETLRSDPDGIGTLIKVSAARCARVSYKTHDGRVSSLSEDLALYDRLVGSQPLHASPCEHQCRPDWIMGHDSRGRPVWAQPDLHGNLVGWAQHRRTLAGQYVEENQ